MKQLSIIAVVFWAALAYGQGASGNSNYPTGSGGNPCTTTALSLQYNNAGAFGCVADFTLSTHTILAGAAGLFDMSGATGANAFKVPSLAGCTSNGTSSLCYDTSNANFHFPMNGADALNVGEASAIAANTIPKSSSSTIAGLTASALSDNATTLTYSGTGGLTLNGLGAEFVSSQGTLTSSLPFFGHTATWNNASTAFNNFSSNVTCTAANAAAVLFAWQVNSANYMNLNFVNANCGAAELDLSNGGANPIARIKLVSGNFITTSGGAYSFTSSSTSAAGTVDSGMDRLGPKLIGVCGNSACSDSTGVLVSGNKMFVSGDFTTAANTSLQTITGLTYTAPASTAVNLSFHCSLVYSQATAAAAVAFGIVGATTAPTAINASGQEGTSLTAFTTGTLRGLATTTATNIVSATPSAFGAIGTAADMFNVYLDGTLQLPSNASPTAVSWQVSTATSGDAVTVYQGSYCTLF